MVHKRFKSQAAAELLHQETNMHFVNPHANKIDLKMFTKHLLAKDETSDLELDPNVFHCSSDTGNDIFDTSTDADDEMSSCEEKKKPDLPKKRKSRDGTFNVVQCGERLIKAKQRFSSWFLLYVDNPNLEDVSFLKDFRKRFRLPYCKYKELLFELKENPLFSRWGDYSYSCAGIPSSPMELLLLGALRYLGRGWTFDDVSESTGISENVLMHFFEIFVTFGSMEFYNKYVKIPENDEDYVENNIEFEAAGFTGACSSTDAVNIVCEKVSWKHRQQHLGHKQSLTARTCNACVNHRRQISHVTPGFPSRWNDKTIVKFDKFINDIKEGKIYQHKTFKLFEILENGDIVEVACEGSWVICDNGYLKWAMLVCPFKLTSNRSEIRFSEWLESMRKDVECTFGILKQRWRILKSGIRVHSIELADKIFKCCCALHNYLLDADGMDIPWQGHFKCDYEDDAFQDYIASDTPSSVHELYRVYGELNCIDLSGAGMNNVSVLENFGSSNSDIESEDESDEVLESHLPTDTTSIREVNTLSHEFFRSKLVEHFDILFKQKKLVWPKASRRKQTL